MHVEIRRSFRRAWTFNLDESKLQTTIVQPWRRGQAVELGDQEWDPRDSRLTILEGPHLDPPDLAVGQGWPNAERASKDVTDRFLGATAAQVAVLAETAEGAFAVAGAVEGFGLRAVAWDEVRARILATASVIVDRAANGLEGVAVVLVVESADPPRSWMLDAGLALGALRGGAIVAQLGEAPPPAELSGIGVIRLDPAQPTQALAERLRLVG